MELDKEKIIEALRPIIMPGTADDIVKAGGIRQKETKCMLRLWYSHPH